LTGWSDTVAKRAEDWAKNCKFEHSTIDFRKYGSDEYGNTLAYGENIAKAATTETAAAKPFPFATLASHVEAWKCEEGNWDCNKQTNYYFATGSSDDGCKTGIDPTTSQPYACGHFTQVVWATTTEIGCALVDCPSGTPANPGTGWRVQLLFCQYNPGGNTQGYHPLDPAGATVVWNGDTPVKFSDSYSKCPSPYFKTAAVTAAATGAMNAEETSTDTTQDSTQSVSNGISVPMSVFVSVTVVCGLIVFLGILIVVAVIVLVKKNRNSMKDESLL